MVSDDDVIITSLLPVHMYVHICRITGFLGSGEFGKVQRGQWTSGTITKDVAVKTLKEDFDEDSKIRFLQEVAIMGQFSHPNVVKLHGLVSTEKPVR